MSRSISSADGGSAALTTPHDIREFAADLGARIGRGTVVRLQAIHRIEQAPHAARQFGRLTLYGLILADRRQFSLRHVPSELVLDGGQSPFEEVNDAEDFVDGLIGSHGE